MNLHTRQQSQFACVINSEMISAIGRSANARDIPATKTIENVAHGNIIVSLTRKRLLIRRGALSEFTAAYSIKRRNCWYDLPAKCESNKSQAPIRQHANQSSIFWFEK